MTAYPPSSETLHVADPLVSIRKKKSSDLNINIRNIKLSLFLITLFVVSWCHTFAQNQDISIEPFELIPAIKKEVERQVAKECLEGKIWWENYFNEQLSYFPIMELQRILRIDELNKNKLIIEFFYPQMGYDPEYGHKTIIYTNRENIELLNNIISESSFSSSVEMKRFNDFDEEDVKSGCFGTGYSYITFLNNDSEQIKHAVKLNIEFK